METIVFENMTQVLEKLGAVDKGRYFMCACPKCEHKEAYIQKQAPNFVNCNRKNNCGVTTYLKYSSQDVRADLLPPEPKTFTEHQQKQLTILTEYFDLNNKMLEAYGKERIELFSEGVINYLGSRGINFDTIRASNVDILIMDNLKTFTQVNDFSAVIDEKYSNDWAKKRNVLFGIRNPETNQIERILARTTDQNEPIKELQLMLKNEGTLVTQIGNRNSNDVYVTESIIDGLSLLEVNSDAYILAMTGTNGVNYTAEYLNRNAKIFENKNINILLDADNAGFKASERFLDVVEGLEVVNLTSTFPKGEDLNSLLQKDNGKSLKGFLENIVVTINQQNLLEKIQRELKTSNDLSFIGDNKEHFMYFDDRNTILHVNATILNKAEAEFIQENSFIKLQLDGDNLILTSNELYEIPRSIENELIKLEFNPDEAMIQDVEYIYPDSKKLNSDDFENNLEAFLEKQGLLPSREQPFNPISVSKDIKVSKQDELNFSQVTTSKSEVIFEKTEPDIVDLISDITIMRVAGSKEITFDIMPPIIRGDVKPGRDYIFKEENANDYVFFEKNDRGISERLSIPKAEFERIKSLLIFEQPELNVTQVSSPIKDLTFENVKHGDFDLLYKIDDNLARRNHQNNSFSDYNGKINEEVVIPYLQEFVKEFEPLVTMENVDALNTRLQDYNKLLVDLNENVFRANKIPSAMIAGPARFPVSKKEQQNERIHKLLGEIHSDDGKRARFIKNTYEMYDEKLINKKQEQKANLSQKAESAGFKTFYKELDNNNSIAGYGIDLEDNRVYIKTNGKPEVEIRGLFKKAGLRWSPKNIRWQRQLTDNALYSLENRLFKPLDIEIDRNSFRNINDLTSNTIVVKNITTPSKNTTINNMSEALQVENMQKVFKENTMQNNHKDKVIENLMTKYRETKDVAVAKELYAELKMGVEKAFNDPKSYINQLQVMEQLSRYSINNQSLLATQMNSKKIPEDQLAFVNTYDGWKKRGYNVKKNEKAMLVVAPQNIKVYKKGNEINLLSKATDEDKKLIIDGVIKPIDITRYRIQASVFHASQTNIPEEKLNEMNLNVKTTDKDFSEQFEYLKHFVEDKGILVQTRDLAGPKGSVLKQGDNDYRIFLDSNNSVEQNIKTLVHEYAHVYMEHLATDKNISHTEAEIQAESVAFMISNKLGLDTSDYSFNYIASYAAEKSNDLLEKHFKTINKAFNNIMDDFQTYNGKLLAPNLEANKSPQLSLNQDVAKMPQFEVELV